MPVLIPRVRTIGVRLSEEEYSTLENFCVKSGARSISDLARTAIWRFVNPANQENALVSAVNNHDTQVKELEQRLELLTAEIALLKARKSSEQESSYRNAGAKKVRRAQNAKGRFVTRP